MAALQYYKQIKGREGAPSQTTKALGKSATVCGAGSVRCRSGHGHTIIGNNMYPPGRQMRRLCFRIHSIYCSKSPVWVLIASCTGTLSATFQTMPAPAANLLALLYLIPQATVGDMVQRAHHPDATRRRISARLTGSLGPYQRMVCIMWKGAVLVWLILLGLLIGVAYQNIATTQLL